MNAFFSYLTNIIYYLIFAAVVGLVAPVGKYRKFVSLVMGFILLGVILVPLTNITTREDLSSWISDLIPAASTTISPETAHDLWHNTYFRDAFETQLISELTMFLKQNNINLHNAAFIFASDFSYIREVHASVSTAQIAERVPFIRIEPVRINQPDEECPVTVSTKTLISQFYNLNMQHINVTVTQG